MVILLLSLLGSAGAAPPLATLSGEGHEVMSIEDAVVLIKRQGKRVEVGAHDPSRETTEKAEAMMTKLIEAGAPAERLVARGYDDTQLLVSRHSNDNASLNRRVELRIVGSKHPKGYEPPSASRRSDGSRKGKRLAEAETRLARGKLDWAFSSYQAAVIDDPAYIPRACDIAEMILREANELEALPRDYLEKQALFVRTSDALDFMNRSYLPPSDALANVVPSLDTQMREQLEAAWTTEGPHTFFVWAGGASTINGMIRGKNIPGEHHLSHIEEADERGLMHAAAFHRAIMDARTTVPRLQPLPPVKYATRLIPGEIKAEGCELNEIDALTKAETMTTDGWHPESGFTTFDLVVDVDVRCFTRQEVSNLSTEAHTVTEAVVENDVETICRKSAEFGSETISYVDDKGRQVASEHSTWVTPVVKCHEEAKRNVTFERVQVDAKPLWRATGSRNMVGTVTVRRGEKAVKTPVQLALNYVFDVETQEHAARGPGRTLGSSVTNAVERAGSTMHGRLVPDYAPPPPTWVGRRYTESESRDILLRAKTATETDLELEDRLFQSWWNNDRVFDDEALALGYLERVYRCDFDKRHCFIHGYASLPE